MSNTLNKTISRHDYEFTVSVDRNSFELTVTFTYTSGRPPPSNNCRRHVALPAYRKDGEVLYWPEGAPQGEMYPLKEMVDKVCKELAEGADANPQYPPVPDSVSKFFEEK